MNVIVPLGLRPPTSVVILVLQDGQVQAILLVAIVFAISRILLRLRDSWADVFVYTIGLCLSQIAIRRSPPSQARTRRARIEFVWTWSLALFSAIATAYLSVIVFVKIVSKPQFKSIDTLQDLANAGLTVYVPDIIDDTGDWMASLRYDMVFNAR